MPILLVRKKKTCLNGSKELKAKANSFQDLFFSLQFNLIHFCFQKLNVITKTEKVDNLNIDVVDVDKLSISRANLENVDKDNLGIGRTEIDKANNLSTDIVDAVERNGVKKSDISIATEN